MISQWNTCGINDRLVSTSWLDFNAEEIIHKNGYMLRIA